MSFKKKKNSVRVAKTLQVTLQLQHFYKLIAAWAIFALLLHLYKLASFLKTSYLRLFKYGLMSTAHGNPYTQVLIIIYWTSQSPFIKTEILCFRHQLINIFVPLEKKNLSLQRSMAHYCPNYYLQYKKIQIKWFVNLQ